MLCCLHSAHQSVHGIKTCANNSIFWPGMNASIWNFKANCSIWVTIAPSQPQEPITITPSSEWLFKQKVMNLFYFIHIAYLTCEDKLTGWLILYHLKPGQCLFAGNCYIHMAPQRNSVLMAAHQLPPAYSSSSLRHIVWSTECHWLHIPYLMVRQNSP